MGEIGRRFAILSHRDRPSRDLDGGFGREGWHRSRFYRLLIPDSLIIEATAANQMMAKIWRMAEFGEAPYQYGF
jgi:hypothetical protein